MENLIAGESGAGPITQFDPTEFAVHFACEVKDFDPTQWIDYKAVAADGPLHAPRAGGRAPGRSRLGPRHRGRAGPGRRRRRHRHRRSQVLRGVPRHARERGPDRVNPFSIVQIIPNLGAGWVSMELGTKGPLSAPCTACAASNMAIGEGLDAIRLGRADAMICGGTEAPVTAVGIAGFGAMRAISRRNEDPSARLGRSTPSGTDS